MIQSTHGNRFAIAGMAAIFAAALSLPSGAQAPAMDKGDLPDYFVGKWTVKGQEQTFIEECRLLTKNSFVICEGTDGDAKQPYKWVRMIGYTHYEDLFNVAEYAGDGSVFEFHGWYDKGNWHFVSHRKYENRLVRIEDRMVPTAKGYTHTRRISMNGRDWETRFVDERIRLPN